MRPGRQLIPPDQKAYPYLGAALPDDVVRGHRPMFILRIHRRGCFSWTAPWQGRPQREVSAKGEMKCTRKS